MRIESLIQYKMVWFLFIFVMVLVLAMILLFKRSHTLLVEKNPPVPADVILVLSGGAQGEREAEAAKLYHEGYTDTIVVSMAKVGWNTYTGDIMREHLIHLGVPDNAILTYGDVTSTREEAEQAVPLLEELAVRKMILTTSSFHSGRAKWIFERTLKEKGIEVISVPVREEEFGSDWWQTHETRKQGASELLKYVWEWFRL
ncbi:hypothetical protein Q73_13225 [Bacillus coahuilensis m2-6]|uniref:YdcF family protein n=1 Tax=Bacillus coahuilensis TaxID=408580 RepID=UPI000185132D|nr:YdcF family protein [Bacillus coahuilensis]KUP05389.1 hypothetical protein Q73_13225 [Bacillus coahuilensis m2-6]